MPANTHSIGSKPARYRIDLKAQLACCEGNYARMCKLMPDLDDRDYWAYRSEPAELAPRMMEIRVKARARYTTMLEIEQSDSLQQWGGDLRLEVRLYHDASMAEVISWSGHKRIEPRYEYPNQQMYQRDEKAQMNEFLADWLNHSLNHGRVAETITF